MVIEQLLLESEIGKENFYLSNTHHKVNYFITQHYHVLDKERLSKILKILGSDQFRELISSFSSLMEKLRNEEEKKIDSKDLFYVGITTGKTTMIDSYHKAINEILATMGTFMGNTVNVLLREILQNISEEEIREPIQETYRHIKFLLREFL